MALKNLTVKAPREWQSDDDAIAAERDNIEIGDFSMLADERHVFISHQKMGESAIGNVSVPKAVFEQMVEWWATGKVPIGDPRPLERALVPDRKAMLLKFPLNDLAIGQVLTVETTDEAVIASLRRAAYNRGRRLGRGFSIRKFPGGARVWRIA